MQYTYEQRIEKLIEFCLGMEPTSNPIAIFRQIAKQDWIGMHGPEHHMLDGACLLTAFYHAGGDIELSEALHKLATESKKMPGAICGLWGVCGSVTSMGAALAIIDGTGPLTTDDSWGNHMLFSSEALQSMAKVGGPRCCKRNAMLSFYAAINYINSYYPVKLEKEKFVCDFYRENEQCIKGRCPFYGGADE